MFARYLEVQHYPTWSELARALRNVHQNELAEKLENIYVTGMLLCSLIAVQNLHAHVLL